MSKEKVTVQDIADALGLSRTTVSKVLNGTPNMPAKTVNSVLNAAREMNYKQFSFIQAAQTFEKQDAGPKRGGNFALLANFLPEHFHIASTIMASLEHELSGHGYSLTIHMLHSEDIHALKLPPNLKLDQVDALLGIEIFDEKYSHMLCNLGKPVLFFDSYYHPQSEPLNANILLMESKNSTYRMIDTVLASAGIEHTGFIGDDTHCISFHERYEGYRQALLAHHLPYEENFCITSEDSFFQKPEFIAARLRQMERLPQLFCCANDLLAWKTISALKSMQLEVPRDILVCGFDDTIMLPSLDFTLTTVTTPSAEMGIMAARILIDQAENPGLPTVTAYLHSKVQIRSSTT